MENERIKRKEVIANMIQDRKDSNQEPTPCIFQITVPNFLETDRLEDNENIKIVIKLLDKYNIEWGNVDTVEGTYNLNRDWIETGDIPCYIEYCGVYPTNWDIEDVETIEQLEYTGKVIIRVLWHPEQEKFIPNN